MKQVQAVLLNPTTIHKDLLPHPDQRQLLYEGAGVRDWRAEVVNGRRGTARASGGVQSAIVLRGDRDENVGTMEPNADYGYDAPYALIAFAALGAVSVVAAIVSWSNGIAAACRRCMAFYAAFFLANASSFLYTTRRGKFQVWDEVLDGLRLRGDERVLDMGCGRGAVLTAVARRLSRRPRHGHRPVEHARSIGQCPRRDDAERRRSKACRIESRSRRATCGLCRSPTTPSTWSSRVSPSTTSARMPSVRKPWRRPGECSSRADVWRLRISARPRATLPRSAGLARPA